MKNYNTNPKKKKKEPHHMHSIKKKRASPHAQSTFDKASIYNFYFENLIYKWIKQFEIQ